jgi:hypothetical protein
MSYSFNIKPDAEGRLVVESESGQIPAGTFSVNGHSSTTGISDEITISHHHPSGTVTVRAHGYAGHEHTRHTTQEEAKKPAKTDEAGEPVTEHQAYRPKDLGGFGDRL